MHEMSLGELIEQVYQRLEAKDSRTNRRDVKKAVDELFLVMSRLSNEDLLQVVRQGIIQKKR